jgi:hypothetical protein
VLPPARALAGTLNTWVLDVDAGRCCLTPA